MYQSFGNALLTSEATVPEGIFCWNGSDPAVRFAIYRNNVMSSLIDVLADNFPVIRLQVGDEFFRAMAAEFVRQHPPMTPVLAYYGDNFSDWISSFPPLAEWPWLPDVAALEFAFIAALHSEDTPRDKELFTDQIKPESMGLVLDSSLQMLSSPWSIYKIWCAHQSEKYSSNLNPYHPENVLLFRQKNDVVILPVSTGQINFIHSLISGTTLIHALENGIQCEHGFSPEKTLILLQKYELIHGIWTKNDK